MPYPLLHWYQFWLQIIFRREEARLSSSLLNIICNQIRYQILTTTWIGHKYVCTYSELSSIWETALTQMSTLGKLSRFQTGSYLESCLHYLVPDIIAQACCSLLPSLPVSKRQFNRKQAVWTTKKEAVSW